MATSYFNGNKIYYDYKKLEYFYEDGTSVDNDNPRKCPLCGKNPSKEGHDACIANLPDVKFACCGHGVEKPYVHFNNGEIKDFETLKDLFKYFNIKDL